MLVPYAICAGSLFTMLSIARKAPSRIVLYLAFAWGCVATTGGVLFGFLTSWLHNRGGRWPLFSLGILLMVFSAVACFAFAANQIPLTIAAFMVAIFLMGGIRGPAFAVVQDIIPSQMRATAVAVFMVSMYLIGVTLGPLLTGLISDSLDVAEGQDALRHALLIVVATSGCAASALAIAAGLFYTVSVARLD